jgi:hypothetical protein
MRAFKWIGFTLLALACGGSGGGAGPELAGTWTATKFEFVSTASPATRVELLAMGGHATLVLRADKTYTVTTEIPGEPTETRSGTWASSSDVLTLRQTGIAGDLQFDYALSGNTLTASGANGEFDFDGDGAMEPAKLSIVATRSP